MPNSSDIVYQGWLTKSPPSKGIFRPRWRKRWFVLRTGSFPNQFLLQYYTDESGRRLKGGINLDECEQLVGPLSVQERHKSTFQIKTPSRTYYLAAENESEMSKWVSSLCHVCSLKSGEDESLGGTVYTRSGDENKPNPSSGNNERPHRTDANESNDSSPSLSTKLTSGPYIPISECFTGKPIPKSESGDVTYCNVFQFPPPSGAPKVNWATHPSKSTDTTPFAGNTPVDEKSKGVAPPRPPKPKTNGSPLAIVASERLSPPSVATDKKSPNLVSETDDGLDSSSTCSSLHSPPGSANVVYCNITELEKTSGQVAPPPVVDRNLKPLRKDGFEVDNKILVNNSSSSQKPVAPYASGTMTLPSRSGPYGVRQVPFFAGPIIDRTRKPPENHLSLGPTPAQMRGHVQSASFSSSSYTQKTLPSSPQRRAGPVVSPNDKRPSIYHDYEQALEMKGTYLQIECPNPNNKEAESPKFPGMKPGPRKSGTSENNESVEYRLIDPILTKALSKTREDREKQRRGNTLSKSHH